MKILVSVGVIVHNEEDNIGQILSDILNQKLNLVQITEVIVVSSGSTDLTNKIVEAISLSTPLISLVKEERRNGKASAVNIFLKEAKENIVVLSSGDLKVTSDCIEHLCAPFAIEHVGMTGVRTVPVNSKETFLGYVAFLLWELHHQLSLINPKMGEMVAFRKVFDSLSNLTSTDEASVELIMKNAGFELRYVPEALVYNKSPEKLHEFIAVRRRNYYGHTSIKKEFGYEVSTMRLASFIRLVPKVSDLNPVHILYLIFAALLEIYSRLLGYIDYITGRKKHHIWDIAHSARDPYVTVKNRLERIDPDSVSSRYLKTLREHIGRYKFATKYVRNKTVLDAACGVGYGAQILNTNCPKSIFGIDINEGAIKSAESKYKSGNINFMVSDVCLISVNDTTFDICVSFETIEHLKDPLAFLKEVNRVLNTKGMLIISTPNSNLSVAQNPYHLNELSASEMKDLLSRFFIIKESYGQREVNKHVYRAFQFLKKSKSPFFKFAQFRPWENVLITENKEEKENFQYFIYVCQKV